MKKTILTFGLIGGAIVFCFVFLIGALCERDIISLDKAEFVGYGAMVISLSMIFFGIKSYRDNYGGGAIRFWKAVQIGLLISAIGSVMYFVGIQVHGVIKPEFYPTLMEKYKEHETNKMKAKGASQVEIDTTIAQMDKMGKMLENPLFMFLIALMEILPVGIIITLISAALLRKRTVLPAVNTA